MEIAERIRQRKHLNADAMLEVLRASFEEIPDSRRDPEIPLADALMAGLAIFALKCPSLLAFEKECREGNIQRLFNVEKVPCDTQMRTILDEVDPERFRPLFADIFGELQRGGELKKFLFLGEHYLVATDGTKYFRSEKVHCDNCLVTNHKNGTVSYSHQLVGASIVSPNLKEVIPLFPEPIVKQDGQTKNDCERNACRRLLPKLRQDHPKLSIVILEDGLASNAPHIRDIQAEGFHFLLGAKPGDHKWLYAEAARRRAADECLVVSRLDPKTKHQQTAVLVRDVPLNESNPDLLVHFLEYSETDPASNEIVKRFGWVTDLDVNEANIWEVVRGGRARWKIENETFNTLKNQGYHFEHNFGHGEKNLSVVFATLMMLAFLVDQVQQLCCPLFQAAWKELGSKRSLWEKVRGRFDNFVLDSMHQLLESIAYGLVRTAPPIAYPAGAPPPPPIDDSS